ncbi:uncharacterized protein V1518DRAFT_410794 [Limtongia smithiae]|uniref:uncharacterized protein n=1 Tax=Limtongia smithiae TaxID=1125753 RepID=UPI0034CF5C57
MGTHLLPGAALHMATAATHGAYLTVNYAPLLMNLTRHTAHIITLVQVLGLLGLGRSTVIPAVYAGRHLRVT